MSRNRTTFSILLSGLLFAVTLPTSGFAAGNYSENFDDGLAQGWTTVNDTFAVTNAYYANTGTTYPQRSIAVYNGTTWNTDYTYNVKLNSDYEADGNRVGE